MNMIYWRMQWQESPLETINRYVVVTFFLILFFLSLLTMPVGIDGGAVSDRHINSRIYDKASALKWMTRCRIVLVILIRSLYAALRPKSGLSICSSCVVAHVYAVGFVNCFVFVALLFVFHRNSSISQ